MHTVCICMWPDLLSYTVDNVSTVECLITWALESLE